MHIMIRVFPNAILVQCGQGDVHTYYDWIMVLDLIRDDDEVTIQNYTIWVQDENTL